MEWRLFEYELLSDLDTLLIDRGIKICNGAKIGYDAVIGNDVRIGNDAVIGNHVKIGKTLFIQPPRHPITYWGDDKICIGCKHYSIGEWQQHFRKIGKAEWYTDEQIEEYRVLIDMIASIHPQWNEYYKSHQNNEQ